MTGITDERLAAIRTWALEQGAHPCIDDPVGELLDEIDRLTAERDEWKARKDYCDELDAKNRSDMNDVICHWRNRCEDAEKERDGLRDQVEMLKRQRDEWHNAHDALTHAHAAQVKQARVGALTQCFKICREMSDYYNEREEADQCCAAENLAMDIEELIEDTP